MGKNSLSQTANSKSLRYFSEMLTGLEFFIFFGSLLGIVREGLPIAGDDDVDFYVNIKHFAEVKERLEKLKITVDYSSWPNDSDCFIQVNIYLEEEQCRCDFYFYDSETDPHFIIDKWNFPGKPDDPHKALKTPKPLIFPIKEVSTSLGRLNLPQYPEIVCEYLYGIDWRTPKKKHVDYKTITLGGRPLRVSISRNGSSKILP